MKEVLFNYDELKKEEIDELIIRTKGLIINSNNEITLGYCHKTYQFPGGHLEDNESLEECLLREIKEETGMEIKNYTMKPFEKITHYTKNYRNTGKNRENIIYYYILKTDDKYNNENAHLDEYEKLGNYVVKTIPLDKVEKILIDSIPDNPINQIIVSEMLEVLNEYKRINNK